MARPSAWADWRPHGGRSDRPDGPGLLLIFGCGQFIPTTTCIETGCNSIREGSRCCCAVCHKSGMDGHPALKRDPRHDPKPEKPKPSYRPGKHKGGKS